MKYILLPVVVLIKLYILGVTWLSLFILGHREFAFNMSKIGLSDLHDFLVSCLVSVFIVFVIIFLVFMCLFAIGDEDFYGGLENQNQNL